MLFVYYIYLRSLAFSIIGRICMVFWKGLSWMLVSHLGHILNKRIPCHTAEMFNNYDEFTPQMLWLTMSPQGWTCHQWRGSHICHHALNEHIWQHSLMIWSPPIVTRRNIIRGEDWIKNLDNMEWLPWIFASNVCELSLIRATWWH
jgi:hypothetical protein